MSDTKIKNQSPLMEVVLALDNYFSEMNRLGEKIKTLEMESEFELEHGQKLIARFAECGEGVTVEINNLAKILNEARELAELVTRDVAAKAELLNTRKVAQAQKFEEFRQLADKVRAINDGLTKMRPAPGTTLSDDDRARLSMTLSELEISLAPLIEQAQRMRDEAHQSKMRLLEQNADSLTQTLQAIQKKLSGLTPNANLFS